MGYKTTTALRTSADSTRASAVEVTVSTDDTGFTLSSTSITETTVFKTLTVTPGSSSTPTEVSGGGATGAGGDKVFYLNDRTVTTSYEVPANTGATTVGPLTLDSGVTVTVGSNSRLVVL